MGNPQMNPMPFRGGRRPGEKDRRPRDVEVPEQPGAMCFDNGLLCCSSQEFDKQQFD